VTTIWKYPFPTTDEFQLDMPAGAKILTVQAQQGHPCMWALVEPEFVRVVRRFRIFGTGYPVDLAPNRRDYIGSYQLEGGALVSHVFEVM
jgi:hypothetical protein